MLCNFSYSFTVVIRNDMHINLLKYFSPYQQCITTLSRHAGKGKEYHNPWGVLVKCTSPILRP